MEEIRQYINDIQKESYDYKVLSLLLFSCENIHKLEEEIINIQKKINQIVDVINSLREEKTEE